MGERLGQLIVFKVKERLSATERTNFFRGLYGHLERSNFGQYTYKREGLLETLPHITLVRAALIVAEENAGKLVAFLRRNCRVTTRKVLLTSGDQRKLYGRMPK